MPKLTLVATTARKRSKTKYAKALRLLRTQAAASQAQMAAAIGVAPSFISHMERGVRRPSLETLTAYANALSISLDSIHNLAHKLQK